MKRCRYVRTLKYQHLFKILLRLEGGGGGSKSNSESYQTKSGFSNEVKCCWDILIDRLYDL